MIVHEDQGLPVHKARLAVLPEGAPDVAKHEASAGYLFIYLMSEIAIWHSE